VRAAALWVSIVLAAVLIGACGGSSSTSAPTTGSAIYRSTCATCHGRSGEGFVGPSLVDIAKRYPNEADQINVVTGGKGQMPAFSGRLTAKQIAAVVAYTRDTFVSTPTTPAVGPPRPSP
jgi:mono/diheme cytochrome c family protein